MSPVSALTQFCTASELALTRRSPVKHQSGPDSEHTTLHLTCFRQPAPRGLETCLYVRSRIPFVHKEKLEFIPVNCFEALVKPHGGTYQVARTYNVAARAPIHADTVRHCVQYAEFLKRAKLITDDGRKQLIKLTDKIGSSNKRAGECLQAMTAYQTAVALGTYFGEPKIAQMLPDLDDMLCDRSSKKRLLAWQCAMSAAATALAASRSELFKPGQVVQISTCFGIETQTTVDTDPTQQDGGKPLTTETQHAELYITVVCAKASTNPYVFPLAYEKCQTRTGQTPQFARTTMLRPWKGMPELGCARESPAAFNLCTPSTAPKNISSNLFGDSAFVLQAKVDPG